MTPAPETQRRGPRAWWLAFVLARTRASDVRLYGARKRSLFAGLGPVAVEIGAGAGVNAAYFDRSTRWLAVEPNVYLHGPLRRAADAHGLALTLVPGTAETLALPDASADAVVSTLVLCSVADPARVLAEARRVLRPGGRLVFVEHVAAEPGSGLRRLQRMLRAPWGTIADGCRPDRDTEALLRAAGFADVTLDRFRLPLGLVAPHIAGVATKAA
ncbi:MAG TPA: methyltransferase domain-containing protein [Rubricoccaceae bacterium]